MEWCGSGGTTAVRRLPTAVAALVGALLLSACAAEPTNPRGSALPVRGTATPSSHTHSPGTPPHDHATGGATTAARPVAAPLRRGERFATLRLPGGPYQPSAPAGGTDDYRCFLVDPGLDADAFVTGSDVLPGNPAVVHHAILFTVPPSQVPAAEQQDAATPGEGWTCFGGTGLPGAGGAGDSLNSAPWLAGWAPGGGETVLRGRTGKWLEAGSRIVLQLHYNLRAGDAPDDTAVRLRLMPGTADLRRLETMLLVAPVELPCTAVETGPLCDRTRSVLDLASRVGSDAGRTVSGLQLLCGGDIASPRAAPTQSCERRAPADMVVRSVAGHMHLLGRSISVDLEPRTGDEQRLLDRTVWDFDNQAATPLEHPVRVQRGDTLRVTCTHDAALRSMVPELADVEPRYVTWGEGTSDEMCLGIVLYTRD